jgi:hypothetical protein
MTEELFYIEEKGKNIEMSDNSMNKELQEWLKETKKEINDIKEINKTSKIDEKKPSGFCKLCGNNIAKFNCLKCGKSVCPSCYFNILGICKKCVPEEYVEKWEAKKPDWEKILGVEWLD